MKQALALAVSLAAVLVSAEAVAAPPACTDVPAVKAACATALASNVKDATGKAYSDCTVSGTSTKRIYCYPPEEFASYPVCTNASGALSDEYIGKCYSSGTAAKCRTDIEVKTMCPTNFPSCFDGAALTSACGYVAKAKGSNTMCVYTNNAIARFTCPAPGAPVVPMTNPAGPSTPAPSTTAPPACTDYPTLTAACTKQVASGVKDNFGAFSVICKESATTTKRQICLTDADKAKTPVCKAADGKTLSADFLKVCDQNPRATSFGCRYDNVVASQACPQNQPLACTASAVDKQNRCTQANKSRDIADQFISFECTNASGSNPGFYKCMTEGPYLPRLAGMGVGGTFTLSRCPTLVSGRCNWEQPRPAAGFPVTACPTTALAMTNAVASAYVRCMNYKIDSWQCTEPRGTMTYGCQEVYRANATNTALTGGVLTAK